MTAEERGVRRRLTAWVLLALAAAVTAPLLGRDLWFDEALTLLDFALLPSIPAIWQAYVIPNNQLLHTALLHFWAPLAGGLPSFNAGLRLLPLATTLVLVLVLWRGFARSCDWAALLTALAAWIVSPPFALFGSALRGYMLAGLAVTAALIAAERWAARGGIGAAAGFFAAAFAGAAAVPTTLLGIGAALLLAFADRRPLRNRRFWGAAGLALAAFALCYGFIARQFWMVCRLGEGWREGWVALAVTGLASLAAFAPLMLTGALFRLRRRRFREGDVWRLCVWLAPLPPCLLLPVAPFPRVFWCLFPLWTVLTARGLRPFFAWARHRRAAAAGLIVLAAAWAVLMNLGALWISDRWIGESDDFFAPYWRREGFRPAEVIAETVRRSQDAGIENPVLYASFAADPWALCLYGRLAGCEVRFDGPRGAAQGPFAGAVFRRGEALPERWKTAPVWFEWKDWVVLK